ncbi:MAG: hypothetical protein KDM63_17755, partial [Verrucomicrobiae bacterium]|nr:hypothetical protein [Verrucomicrobiae bacterium]
ERRRDDSPAPKLGLGEVEQFLDLALVAPALVIVPFSLFVAVAVALFLVAFGIVALFVIVSVGFPASAAVVLLPIRVILLAAPLSERFDVRRFAVSSFR